MSEPMTDERLDEISPIGPEDGSGVYTADARVIALGLALTDARAKLEQVLAVKVPELEAALTRFKQAVGVGPMPRQAPLTEAEARAWWTSAREKWMNDDADARDYNNFIASLLCVVWSHDIPPEVRPKPDINAHGIGSPRAQRGCPCFTCQPVDPDPSLAEAIEAASERHASTIVLGHLDGKPVHARIGEMPAWVQQAVAAADAPPPSGGQTLPPWRPKVGDRVRTAEVLTSARYTSPWSANRRANAPGVVQRLLLTSWRGSDGYVVRHDDGTEAPYDEDELRPA